MKTLSLLALFLVSGIAAAAYPTIGDTAVYTMNGSGTLTLSNKGFDSSTNQWTIFEDIGNGNMGYAYWSEDEIFHQAQVLDVLAHCETYGGATETITVPAGTFKTCKISSSDVAAWIADVPFGEAKFVSPQMTLELKSYTNGAGAR
jgi:hypothetical protein